MDGMSTTSQRAQDGNASRQVKGTGGGGGAGMLGYNTTGKGLQQTHTCEGWKGVTGTGQERDRGHTGDTRREEMQTGNGQGRGEGDTNAR